MRHNAKVDQSVLQFLVAAIAAGASLTVVLLGIDQLSSGARLRNLESTLRAVRATPDGEARDDVVASLHRTALARLIAREAVPFRSFLVPSLLTIVPLATALREALSPSFDWFGILVIALSTSFTGIAFQQVTNLVHERARLRMWFEQGRTPLRAFTRWWPWLEGHPRQIGLAYAEGTLSLVVAYCSVRAIIKNIHSVLGTTLFVTATLSTVALAFLIRATIAVVATNLSEEPPGHDASLRPSWVQPLPSAFPSPAGSQEPDEPTQPVDHVGQPTSVP